MLFAYIDFRPILFMVGLPVFIGLSLLLRRLAKAEFSKTLVVLSATLLFTVLFPFFLTSLGPFVDQKEIREYLMTWEIKPQPSRGMKEAEVVLMFVDFPGHFSRFHSNELATHLRAQGGQPVKVRFEVTSDYGKLRGFRVIEIAGISSWKEESSSSGSMGSPNKSPWD